MVRKRTASQPAAKSGHARLTLLAAAFLVSSNLALFGPSEIFFSNPSEFDLTFRELLPFLLVMTTVTAVPLALIGMWMPARMRQVFTSVVFALGLVMWVQSSFLRWDYGLLDGKGIDWSGYTWRAWIDAAIWLTAGAVAVRFHRRISRHALFVALAFIAIQSAVIVTRAANNDGGDSDEEKRASAVPQALCQVSSSRNVFHILLDSFQTDVFLELVREGGLEDAFDGFTVYPDNASTARRTVISVPSTFSTNVYDGSETESEYFHRAMGGSFPFLLAQQNWVVNLMPQVGMEDVAHTNYFTPSVPYAEPRRTLLLRTSGYLVDVSLFRQVPHIVKPAVYNNQNWRLSSFAGDPPNHKSFAHKAFFRDYISKLEIGTASPAYHFVHLWPPHPPFVTLPDGRYAGKRLPYNRENYKQEAKFILELFFEFLDKLKQLGVYDSSIVLLHGDHGMGFAPVVEGRQTREQMGSVAALLALKPFRSRGVMRLSMAQTSLTDVPATLMGYLGIKHPYPGDPIESIDPATNRTRRIVSVENRSAAQPTILRWLLRGSVYDSTSWHKLKAFKVSRKVPHYDWGQRLTFGVTGNGDRYLTSGWSTTSPTAHWNDGSRAVMTFPITDPGRDAAFRILFLPFIRPGKVDRQRMRLSINGRAFPEYVCETAELITLQRTIPADLLKEGKLVFSFEFPDAVAPKDIGEGRESRKIAIGIYALQIVVGH